MRTYLEILWQFLESPEQTPNTTQQIVRKFYVDTKNMRGRRPFCLVGHSEGLQIYFNYTSLFQHIGSVLPISSWMKHIATTPMVWRLGRTDEDVSVFIAIPKSEMDTASAIDQLLLSYEKPFSLLTPTNTYLSSVSGRKLTNNGCRYYALAEFFSIDSHGHWRSSLTSKQLSCKHHTVDESKPYVFEKVGGVWRVVFDNSREFFLPHSKGASYLEYLLHHPNQQIHVIDLEVQAFPEMNGHRQRRKIKDGSRSASLANINTKIAKLNADLDMFREKEDQVSANECVHEIEVLSKECDRIKREVNDDGERARSTVCKAIRLVYRNLHKCGIAGQKFSEHLQLSVDLGYEIFYNPRTNIKWD